MISYIVFLAVVFFIAMEIFFAILGYTGRKEARKKASKERNLRLKNTFFKWVNFAAQVNPLK